MRLRLSLAATTAALTLGSLLVAPSTAYAAGSSCVGTPLSCVSDSAMVELERRIEDNFRFGQAIEIDYRTPQRVLGDVASGGAWGDSALWTGVYLAGQSMRYAVASQKVHQFADGTPGRTYWSAQRSEALARTRLMTEKFHLLATIGKQWVTETQVNTAYDPFSPAGGPPSFGGGVIQGQEGLLMRACAPKPADTPDGIGIPPGGNQRIFGPFWWDDGRDNGIQDKVAYYCETAPSRDSYAGTLYGLMYAYDLVSQDDPAMRARIRYDVLALARRLVKFGWSFPRPHGNISVPKAPLNVPITGFNGHDFDNFISPAFMQQVPSARLNVVQSALRVAREAPLADTVFWKAVWAEEKASQLPALALSMQVDAAQPNDGYYKYNLNHLTMANLLRLESDSLVRKLIRQAFGVMDRTTGDDGNAHFESITFAATGEQSRLDNAALHLGQWLDYRHAIETGPVVNSTSCHVQIECVPNAQLDMELNGQIITIPDPASLQPGYTLPPPDKLRARYPLPVAKRVPRDFLWQSPPTKLNESTSPTHQAPGIDYLTPYWTIRYYSEIARPALAPLPAYLGPAHF